VSRPRKKRRPAEGSAAVPDVERSKTVFLNSLTSNAANDGKILADGAGFRNRRFWDAVAGSLAGDLTSCSPPS
jgi:hypothetical protein